MRNALRGSDNETLPSSHKTHGHPFSPSSPLLLDVTRFRKVGSLEGERCQADLEGQSEQARS
jgi:hypothetical protein